MLYHNINLLKKHRCTSLLINVCSCKSSHVTFLVKILNDPRTNRCIGHASLPLLSIWSTSCHLCLPHVFIFGKSSTEKTEKRGRFFRFSPTKTVKLKKMTFGFSFMPIYIRVGSKNKKPKTTCFRFRFSDHIRNGLIFLKIRINRREAAIFRRGVFYGFPDTSPIFRW